MKARRANQKNDDMPDVPIAPLREMPELEISGEAADLLGAQLTVTAQLIDVMADSIVTIDLLRQDIMELTDEIEGIRGAIPGVRDDLTEIAGHLSELASE